MAIYATKYENKKDYGAPNEFSTPSLQIYGTQPGVNTICSDERKETSITMRQQSQSGNMNYHQAQSAQIAPVRPMGMKSKLRLLKKKRKSAPSGMKTNHENIKFCYMIT